MNKYNKSSIYIVTCLIIISSFHIFVLSGSLSAEELTLNKAIDIAVNNSRRGEIIRGDLEVAERNYYAKRIKFYMPDISLRGSIPGYDSKEEYTFLPGTDIKTLSKRTSFDFNSYINLEQNLITGGKLTLKTYLNRNKLKYPKIVRLSGDSTKFGTSIIDEQHRGGSFELSFEQPILKPSDPKNELNNQKDDLETARLTQLEETEKLKEEVTEAYFGVLQTMLKQQIAADKYESARLQAEIDSSKFMDGVLSEEAWLESASARLDAELEQFDIDNELKTKRRELAILLDLTQSEELKLSTPEITFLMTDAEKKRLYESVDNTIPIRKAEYAYKKAQRAAHYEASSRGITGTLSASYSKRLDDIRVFDQPVDNLNLNTWGVKLEFIYPVWDGGASSAAVKAADLEAEKARIEYEKAQQASRSEIENLINSITVTYRKLDVLKKQIALADNRLKIAKSRYENGEISRVTLLESSVKYLETKNKYYDELKKYLIDTFKLEGKFIS